MTDSQTITRARKLLENDETEAARDLLLKAAYGPTLDARAQAAFEELFPVEGLLKKQLSGTVKDLRAKDVATRREAADTIAKAALAEESRERAAWLKDPRTTEALTVALRDEDPLVVEKAIVALSGIAGRYLADFRAYPDVLPLLESKRQLTRLRAVIAAWALAGYEASQSVVPRFKDKVEAVRAVAVVGPAMLGGEGRVPAAAKKILRDPLVAALKDTSPDVRMRASHSLRVLGDPSVIEPLRAALAVETNAITREALENNLQALSAKGA
ncbi:HEAT repeat domain-containing protein [Myxococcus sp. MISCRS1]|uniref:HEAT repeat domain-containing protein n=1 Tax=Myxococcus TaxID=32 RepID=UPI00226DC893|nr:HEAT repeat domain-containing protein [Myxococcus sp. MISCRS1]MCY1002891.1 HEAT repeat domain-containing protein [Myxococcus sp. MISCRS1]BDT35521.1 HEAT repeat domain-containing protein [Myxococcus sp. MH1]